MENEGLDRGSESADMTADVLSGSRSRDCNQMHWRYKSSGLPAAR